MPQKESAVVITIELNAFPVEFLIFLMSLVGMANAICICVMMSARTCRYLGDRSDETARRLVTSFQLCIGLAGLQAAMLVLYLFLRR